MINYQFIISHQRLFGTEVKQFQKQIEKLLKKFALNINLIHAHVAMPAGAVALGMKQKFQIPISFPSKWVNFHLPIYYRKRN
jgi:ABC-type multidrug transport system ATPase subunit